MQNMLQKLNKKRLFVDLVEKNSQRYLKRRTRSHKRYKRFQIIKKVKKSKANTLRYSQRKPSLLLIKHQPSLEIKNGDLMWLSTHHWHSKRFHMRPFWGYSLPLHSASHGLKYVSKILKESCSVHDMSYIQPIEIKGSIDDIVTLLGHYTDPLFDWSDSLFLSGGIEKEFTFYEFNEFPQSPMGPVKLLLYPPDQAWLWVHPSIYSDTLSQFENGLQIVQNLTIKPLLGKYSRFSIKGSTSINLLQNVFYPVSISNNSEQLIQDEKVISRNGKLFLDLINCEGINNIWPHQAVLCFQVLDCRELIFSKNGASTVRESRRKRLNMIQKSEKRCRLAWPEDFSTSFFTSFSDLPPTEKLLNSLRHQERLRDWTINHEDNLNSPVLNLDNCSQHEYAFPIMVIRNKGNLEHSISSISHRHPPKELMGWDIILPTSCSRSAWLALIFAGAKSLGLEEMEFVNQCLKIPSFPRDFPDTPSGREYWKNIESRIEKLKELRPRRKKLISNSYCYPEWCSLYDSNEPTFTVIRNIEYLSPFIPEAIFDRPNRYFPCKSRLFLFDSTHHEYTLEPLTLPFQTAIRITLSSTGRGVPKSGARLYAPLLADYENWINYRLKRNKKTISKNRRVADWWGISSVSSHTSNERKLIGYLTSSANTQLTNNIRLATGFCEALLLREMLYYGINMCKGEGQMLIIYQNLHSKWLRPGLIEIHGT